MQKFGDKNEDLSYNLIMLLSKEGEIKREHMGILFLDLFVLGENRGNG